MDVGEQLASIEKAETAARICIRGIADMLNPVCRQEFMARLEGWLADRIDKMVEPTDGK